MSNVNLDNDALKTVLAKAVLDTLTPEKKDELISAALKELIAVPPKPAGPYGYNKERSKLEELFDATCADVARGIVREEMNKPENADKIRDLVTRAWEKFLKDEARVEKAVSRMSDALVSAMVDREYR